eukprot:scaffold27834_cov52-Phaeocystis_antarctica.AAC.4
MLLCLAAQREESMQLTVGGGGAGALLPAGGLGLGLERHGPHLRPVLLHAQVDTAQPSARRYVERRQLTAQQAAAAAGVPVLQGEAGHGLVLVVGGRGGHAA